MLHHTLDFMQGLLAQAPSPTPTAGDAATDGDVTKVVNVTGILGVFAKVCVPVLFGFIGVWILARAHRGRTSEVVTTGGIAIIGVAFLAGAGVFFFLGDAIVHVVLGS